jgi:hypothetical protein
VSFSGSFIFFFISHQQNCWGHLSSSVSIRGARFFHAISTTDRVKCWYDSSRCVLYARIPINSRQTQIFITKTQSQLHVSAHIKPLSGLIQLYTDKNVYLQSEWFTTSRASVVKKSMCCYSVLWNFCLRIRGHLHVTVVAKPVRQSCDISGSTCNKNSVIEKYDLKIRIGLDWVLYQAVEKMIMKLRFRSKADYFLIIQTTFSCSSRTSP